LSDNSFLENLFWEENKNSKSGERGGKSHFEPLDKKTGVKKKNVGLRNQQNREEGLTYHSLGKEQNPWGVKTGG